MSKVFLVVLFALLTGFWFIMPVQAAQDFSVSILGPTTVKLEDHPTVGIKVSNCIGQVTFAYNFNGSANNSSDGLNPVQLQSNGSDAITSFQPTQTGTYNMKAFCGPDAKAAPGNLVVTSGATLNSAPTNLKIDGVNVSYIGVTWDALAGADNYKITYQANGGTAITDSTAYNHYTGQNLTSGTSYTISVQGCNAQGCGPAATVTSSTDMSTQPGACCKVGDTYNSSTHQCDSTGSNHQGLDSYSSMCQSGYNCNPSTNKCEASAGSAPGGQTPGAPSATVPHDNTAQTQPPAQVSSASVLGKGCTDPNAVSTAIGCISTDPQSLVKTLVQFATGAGGGIALLMMIAGSFQMITSGGNPDALKKGRGQFESALVGLLFIVFAVLLMQVIGYNILGLPGFQPS